MRPVDLGDCERTRPTGLAQPANALSSLGFLPAALWVGRHGPAGAATGTLVAVMAANGIGSFLYHGPYSEAGARLHDAAAVALGGVIGAIDSVEELGSHRLAAAVALASASAAVASAADRRITPVAASVVAASLVVVEVAVAVRRRRRGIPPRRPVVALAGAAGASYLLGRSDSPTCRPASPAQAHAAWHLLAAAATAAWARGRPGRR